LQQSSQPPAEQIGVQSYTYRKFPVRRAIEEAARCGCRALELWPGHLPADASEAEAEAVRASAREHGIRICGYGVVGLSPQTTGPHLRLARRLGCDYVSIDVRPEDRAAQAAACALAAELGLRLGIHNHGPGHHYSSVDSVRAVLDAQPAVLGACVDTGHFLRSGEDPVQAIVSLGRRVHAVHLKDFTDARTEVLPGTGRLDLAAAVRALRAAGFSTAYVLEYEADADDPTPSVTVAVQAVQAALESAGAQAAGRG
jgi:inosose dehydratase